MEFDPEDLREHYAMLSDEALLALDRSELIEVAQQVYDQELRKRRLTPALPAESMDELGDGETDETKFNHGFRPKADWLDDAACATVFVSSPGRSAAPDAENARDVLEGAGIPCYIQVQKRDSPDDRRRLQHEFRILVPGKLNLEAVSVLDKKIFNLEIEAEYRTHFEQLSDDELRALDPAVLLAGLADRIERLTRAYKEEIARRRME